MSSINSMVERFILWFDEKDIRRRGRIGDIAKATGYSASMVAKILTGHAEASDRFISAVCNAYGIDKQWIETGVFTDRTAENEAKLEAEADYMTSPAFDKKEIRFEVFGKDYSVFIEAINELRSMYEPARWEAVALLKKLNAKYKTPGLDDECYEYPPIK